MKKEFRITKSSDFKTTMDQRHLKKCSELSIFVAKNHIGHIRVGISTSTRLGNAVVRNRCRRLVREVVRHVFVYSEAKDFVIIVKNEFVGKSFLEVKTIIENLYNKSQEDYK